MDGGAMSDIDDSSIISELRYDGTEFGKMVAARITDLKDCIVALEALVAEQETEIRRLRSPTMEEYRRQYEKDFGNAEV